VLLFGAWGGVLADRLPKRTLLTCTQLLMALPALATIARHGPLTPSELAARERIQRPTATRVLARLEETGLVLRAPDPADRRSSLVTVSPAGAALLEELRTRKDAFLSERLEALGDRDRATLERAASLLEDLLA